MLHIYIVLFEVEKIEIHAVEYKLHIYHDNLSNSFTYFHSQSDIKEQRADFMVYFYFVIPI